MNALAMTVSMPRLTTRFFRLLSLSHPDLPNPKTRAVGLRPQRGDLPIARGRAALRFRREIHQRQQSNHIQLATHDFYFACYKVAPSSTPTGRAGQFFDIFTRVRSIDGGACGNPQIIAEKHNKLRRETVGLKNIGSSIIDGSLAVRAGCLASVPCSQITQL